MSRVRSLPVICGLLLGLGVVAGRAHATGGDTGGGGGDYSSAWFISPLPNTVYESAPVTIDVEVGVYQGVDSVIDIITLYVDGQQVGQQSCPSGCIFADVELTTGEHDLELATDSGYMTTTIVYVDVEPPSDSDPSGRGCTCSTQEDTPWLWGLLTLPGLLLLSPVVRRER